VLLGAGAGLFFPAGLQGVAAFGGTARRGFAMGVYGVAFSAGLTVAALFAALGASAGWRVPFWIAAAVAAVALLSMTSIHTVRPERGAPLDMPWRAVLGLPTIVGTVGAVLQYGVLAFFTTYAVDQWDLSEARAASVLAVGRVLSIVAKLIGGAATDRIGPRASVLRTGVVLGCTGLLWVLLPAGWPAYAFAAIFAGTVSSIFPAANVMAVDRFGHHGLALGAYRSLQIAIGAVAGVLIGNSPWGLHATVTIAVLTPFVLLWFCRPEQVPERPQTPIAAP
jgi:predicted MFS family arabinose efflux permease